MTVKYRLALAVTACLALAGGIAWYFAEEQDPIVGIYKPDDSRHELHFRTDGSCLAHYRIGTEHCRWTYNPDAFFEVRAERMELSPYPLDLRRGQLIHRDEIPPRRLEEELARGSLAPGAVRGYRVDTGLGGWYFVYLDPAQPGKLFKCLEGWEPATYYRTGWLERLSRLLQK